MTIAACYLSPEGVVLGADSTSTVFVPGRGGQSGSEHQYNFAQKVFEYGKPGSSVGIALWGLGSLQETSHRTLIAEAAHQAHSECSSLEDAVHLTAAMFWDRYSQAFEDPLREVRAIVDKGEDASGEEQEDRLFWEQILSGGICMGGRWGDDHIPRAFEFVYGPTLTEVPTPQPLSMGTPRFWGCPNLIQRLTLSMDAGLFDRILNSGKWTGTPEELLDLVEAGALGQPWDLPLREAIDWIYASIYTTIKAMKFSHLMPVCGGPIEIAVISSDRSFRWVRHKHLGDAISAHQRDMEQP